VNGQFKAELLKIRSTRTTIGLVLGMIALILLFSLLSGLLTKAPSLVTAEDQRGLLSVGSLAGVFSALAGIMLITSEYRYGTIRPTFLFTPKRSRVLAAKLAAGLLAGLIFGIVAEGLGFAVGYAALAGRGIHLVLNGNQITLLLLGTIAARRSGERSASDSARSSAARSARSSACSPGASSPRTSSSPSSLRRPLRTRPRIRRTHRPHHQTPPPRNAGGLTLIAWTAALALIGITVAVQRDVN
jgi:ABC-type transport system involved in multi-copper enzyme maturation, permease component